MALSKKMLQAMGLEDAQIEQIIEAHRETINGLTEERDNLKDEIKKAKDEAERLVNVEKDLLKAQAKVEESEKTAEKLKNLQTEFENYKTDIEAKETKAKKENAYKELLAEAGVSDKRFDSILKITDLSGIEFEDDGKVKDSKTVVENIKKEWADFVVTGGTRGTHTATPPESSGTGTDIETLEKMSMAEYIEARKKM